MTEKKNIYDQAQEEVDTRVSNFFKIKKTGVYKIVVLSELEHKEKTFDGDENPTKLGTLLVDYNGEQLSWDFGVGGKNSLYGQIVAVGKAKRKLTGETLTISAKNDGNRNDYTVMEYMELQNEQKLEKMFN